MIVGLFKRVGVILTYMAMALTYMALVMVVGTSKLSLRW